MDDMKKEWVTPTITKVKLEFDKEMSNNCRGSNKPSKNNSACGNQNVPGCWSNNKPGKS